MTNRYEVGNAIVLTGTFQDKVTQQYIIPEVRRVNIYNIKHELIDQIPLGEPIDNVYSCIYTFNDPGLFYYEFYGERNGLKNTGKNPIEIVWNVN